MLASQSCRRSSADRSWRSSIVRPTYSATCTHPQWVAARRIPTRATMAATTPPDWNRSCQPPTSARATPPSSVAPVSTDPAATSRLCFALVTTGGSRSCSASGRLTRSSSSSRLSGATPSSATIPWLPSLIGLRLLDSKGLVALALGRSRLLVSTRGVDVVHCVLDPLVGLDVRDQGLDDLVAVVRHLLLQRVLDVLRDGVRVRVCLVEVHRRDVRADHVEGIGLHLHFGIVELVEGVLHLRLIATDHVLDRELADHEYVVLGLRLDVRVELLDLQAHAPGHLLHEGRLALKSRAGHANELAEPLDDGTLLLLYGEKEERHREVLSRCARY